MDPQPFSFEQAKNGNAESVHLDKQPVALPLALFGGMRYWAVSPEGARPTNWGA